MLDLPEVGPRGGKGRNQRSTKNINVKVNQVMAAIHFVVVTEPKPQKFIIPRRKINFNELTKPKCLGCSCR